jgi:hypothetical protein
MVPMVPMVPPQESDPALTVYAAVPLVIERLTDRT